MKNTTTKTTLPTPGTAGELMELMVAFLELDYAVEKVKEKNQKEAAAANV